MIKERTDEQLFWLWVIVGMVTFVLGMAIILKPVTNTKTAD